MSIQTLDGAPAGSKHTKVRQRRKNKRLSVVICKLSVDPGKIRIRRNSKTTLALSRLAHISVSVKRFLKIFCSCFSHSFCSFFYIPTEIHTDTDLHVQDPRLGILRERTFARKPCSVFPRYWLSAPLPSPSHSPIKTHKSQRIGRQTSHEGHGPTPGFRVPSVTQISLLVDTTRDFSAEWDGNIINTAHALVCLVLPSHAPQQLNLIIGNSSHHHYQSPWQKHLVRKLFITQKLCLLSPQDHGC